MFLHLKTTPALTLHRTTRSVPPTLSSTAQPLLPLTSKLPLLFCSLLALPSPRPSSFATRIDRSSFVRLVALIRAPSSPTPHPPATLPSSHTYLYMYVFPPIISHTWGAYLTDMFPSLLMCRVSIRVQGLSLLIIDK
jgi:hypothetical protein